MSTKKDDDAWISGCLVLVAAFCASIGVGYIFGAGYGWMFLAVFFAAAVFRFNLRKRRVAA